MVGAPVIVDSLQDIVIRPTPKEVTFAHYIELFKSTKVKPYFRYSNQVYVVFDFPKEDSPKNMIRKHKDRDRDIISQSKTLNFDESTPIPPAIEWKEFIANRCNKKHLVNLIVSN